jgi:hypothetical protein
VAGAACRFDVPPNDSTEIKNVLPGMYSMS